MADPKFEKVETHPEKAPPCGLMHKKPEEDYSDPVCPCEAEPYWRAQDDQLREEVLDDEATDPAPGGRA